MKTYVIGDLQGCAHEAEALLEKIAIDAGADSHARILFVGDLINRGPESLLALRRMKALAETSGGRVEALLGNHDLHLLAVAAGAQRASKSDTLDDILAAPDRDELLAWLRGRPLAIFVDAHLLVHAGVAPQWDAAQTMALAGEVEEVLRGDGWIDFLANMYGNRPDRWDDKLAWTGCAASSTPSPACACACPTGRWISRTRKARADRSARAWCPGSTCPAGARPM
jgi:bis(5'-nucleosyl)-tetraphosphatase (symmetrical)